MSERKYRLDAVSPRIEAFLGQVLKDAGLHLKFQIGEGGTAHPDFENPEIAVRFTGQDVDILLGNRAELLLALEQLTMEVLRMPSEDHSRISFDANDYRALRIEELRLSAAAAAERVKGTGMPFAFNPMNSRERRVIHLALRNEPAVRSESSGMAGARRVVIYPAGMPASPEFELGAPGPRTGPPPPRARRARR